MISSSPSILYRFLFLYGFLYAGFGVQSPYLPILLDNRHLRPETIALALAAGTAMRLMAAQAVARLGLSVAIACRFRLTRFEPLVPQAQHFLKEHNYLIPRAVFVRSELLKTSASEPAANSSNPLRNCAVALL